MYAYSRSYRSSFKPPVKTTVIEKVRSLERKMDFFSQIGQERFDKSFRKQPSGHQPRAPTFPQGVCALSFSPTAMRQLIITSPDSQLTDNILGRLLESGHLGIMQEGAYILK